MAIFDYLLPQAERETPMVRMFRVEYTREYLRLKKEGIPVTDALARGIMHSRG